MSSSCIAISGDCHSLWCGQRASYHGPIRVQLPGSAACVACACLLLAPDSPSSEPRVGRVRIENAQQTGDASSVIGLLIGSLPRTTHCISVVGEREFRLRGDALGLMERMISSLNGTPRFRLPRELLTGHKTSLEGPENSAASKVIIHSNVKFSVHLRSELDLSALAKEEISRLAGPGAPRKPT